jgi:PAS domain S-box-containing protein
MNKNTRHIKKSGTIGQSGKTKKMKQKDRGVSESNNQKPIQAAQNHSTIKWSLKKKPVVPADSSTPSASLGQALQRNPSKLLRIALIIALYLLAFIILDLVTKQYEEFPGIVAWYPPAGLTYALLLVFGMRFVPGVTIALFTSSLFVYRMPQPAYLLFLWALIISLIYGAVAAFLRRVVHFDWQLRKVRDVNWFVIMTLLASALLAVLSVMSSALTSNMAQSEILKAILDWWIGETIGVLTVTPFVLVYVMPGLKRLLEGQPVRSPAHKAFPRPTLAVIGQTLSLVFTLFWVFSGRVPGGFQPLYLITLPLIWIALDHGFKGVTAGIVAMNFGVMFSLWLFHSNLANLGELQLLMIVNCIVGLFMGAAVTERIQAEQVIQASEKKFRQLFDNSPLGQSMTEINGSVSVNNTLCKMLGYTKAELSNKKWQEITPIEDIQDTEKNMQVLLEGKKESVRYEKRFIHKNGSRVWVEINSFLNRDAQGNPTYFITTINNISERKKAEEKFREENELKNTITNTSPVGITMVDRDGVIRFANPQAEKILGLTKAKLARLHYNAPQFRISAINGDPFPDDQLPFTRVRSTLKLVHDVQHAIVLKNKKRILLSVNAAPLFDENGLFNGMVSSIEDITNRNKAEQEILRLNQELEQRVKDRTTKLEAANTELDAFAYSVSHDLRAPLRAMEGFSEALKTGYPEKLDEQGQHYLTRIQEASLEMGQLIEALLSLSRVTRNELKSESIDLSLMAREIADEMKKENPKRKVEVEISKGMEVQGDARLIKIAMENLVNNAFKFTSMRDQAHIAIGIKKEAGETAFFVRDDGVGFDMEYASKLFVPFQRLHAKEKFTGSGIGLATVKRIVTRHGGRIWAEAGVDQGATFYFTIGGK